MANRESVLEADLSTLSPEELRLRFRVLCEQQRQLRDQRKGDEKIAEALEYERAMYGTPNSDIEREIKLIRRVSKTLGVSLDKGE